MVLFSLRRTEGRISIRNVRYRSPRINCVGWSQSIRPQGTFSCQYRSTGSNNGDLINIFESSFPFIAGERYFPCKRAAKLGWSIGKRSKSHKAINESVGRIYGMIVHHMTSVTRVYIYWILAHEVKAHFGRERIGGCLLK